MNYKLNISYKGTAYSGFAKQKNNITIQGIIEEKIKELFNVDVILFASGRTDKYVHAIQQTINIKHKLLNYEPDVIKNALNSKLPKDITINQCEIIDDNFHARFNSKNKTYLYKLNLDKKFNIFEQDIVYQYNNPIDYKKLNEYIDLIIGKHDFLSFSTSELNNTIRTIIDIKYDVKDNILFFYITGDGFLRNMVRMIIGVFLNYNENKISLNDIKKLLQFPKKGSGIRKVNGCGLYLLEVKYN